MQQVNVFIETSSRFRGNVERKCGYVLSTQLRTGKETREHFGRVTGTYHQAILLTMVDALNHMTRTCDVCFYISDLYVTSRLGKITEMAGSGWECLGTITKSGTRFTYYKDEKGGIWFDDEPIGGKPEWMQRADKERRRRHRRHP